MKRILRCLLVLMMILTALGANALTALEPDTQIDLGAIAKGYASDRIADIFRENGCTDVEAFASPVEAFRKALEEKTEDSLLFCVGSLYLVGIIKEEIRRNDL